MSVEQDTTTWKLHVKTISLNSCNEKIFFTIAVINSVSTIAAESSYVASASATDDLSNDKDSVEVDYSKTKKDERYYVQDYITKCNDGNDTQKTKTEDIAASVLLELKSQQVRPEPQDDLKTDFF